MTLTPEQKTKIDQFLNRRLIGRLATVSPKGQPHVVPVWYLWDGETIWVHSFSSTRKIDHLKHNPRCALTVDTESASDGMMGVLIKGQAEIITSPASRIRTQGEKIYRRYLTEAELAESEPQGWLSSEEGLLLKIAPSSIKAF